MLDRLAICAATVFATGFGSALTPTRAYATTSIAGECPVHEVQNAMAVAEKQCKRDGGEVVITYMNCDSSGMTMRFVCV